MDPRIAMTINRLRRDEDLRLAAMRMPRAPRPTAPHPRIVLASLSSRRTRDGRATGEPCLTC